MATKIIDIHINEWLRWGKVSRGQVYKKKKAPFMACCHLVTLDFPVKKLSAKDQHVDFPIKF